MNRSQKVALLLSRGADDERRLALDALDDSARRSSTWGSKEHRDARDRVEKIYDETKRRLEGLPEEQLDRELEREPV